MILHFIHTFCKFSTFPILFLVQFSLAAPTQSQPLPDSVTRASENRIVRHIQFTGNNSVSSRTLEQLIRTQTNRSLFGIDALTPWVFVYKITASRFGEAPSLFDPEVAATDVERIALYYESNGFFDAKISVSTQSLKKNRVRVVFSIDEGEKTIIETVSYTGFPTSLSTDEIRSFTKDGFPAEDVINDTTLRVNRGYNVQEIRDEQDRILNFLKDNGYASALRDSILVLAKQQELVPKYLDIRFVIQPGDEFQFGEVSIELRGPATESSTERRFVIYDDVSASDINVKIDSTAIVDPRALVETLNFRPDQRFNQRLLQNSIGEMQSLEMLRINRFGLGDPIIGSGDSLYLPVFFDLQALPRHTLRTELFGMERYGYGTGIGLTYTNNNAFRRAESFRFQLNSSFEFVSSSTLENGCLSSRIRTIVLRRSNNVFQS